MIDDPYKELGIERGASQDDIKRAYRRKAKEYHPDLHPDDPKATEKMNRINEAYDMLTHPEKYEARRAQEARQNAYQNAYQNPFQGYSGYGSAGQSANQGQYQGGQQYYDPFGFGSMFGFGQQTSGSASMPHEQPTDSPLMRMAVRDINARQFQAAVNHLSQVVSTGRNARWYYLSALAEKGLGNVVRATDHIQRAVQLDPNNALYHQILNELRYSGRTYEQNAASHGFNVRFMSPGMICTSLCLAQMLCNCLCGGGGGYYYGPMR